MSRDFVVWGSKKKNSYKAKKAGKYKNKDSEQADIRIKFCIKCKVCWEKEVSRGNSQVRYYEDFVSYGKTRSICPKCS